MASDPMLAAQHVATSHEDAMDRRITPTCVLPFTPATHKPVPASRAPSATERRRVALLAHTIENEVIPRLLLAREVPAAAERAGEAGPDTADVEALVALAMRNDLAGSVAFLSVLRTRGMSLERLYLDLLAPAARRLGVMWAEDTCDFTTVTVGLCCLQQIVMEHSAAFRPRMAPRDIDRRVLLAPAPGEQHSFGLLLVGEFFHRQGWDVHSATGANAAELVALVRRQWFAAVGLSIACESRLDIIASVIRDMRRTARNARMGVLVGGRVFTDRPELTALVGADAMANDAQGAVLKAETMLALLGREA